MKPVKKISAALALLLFFAACGLKPGVEVTGGLGVTGDSSTGLGGPASDEVAGEDVGTGTDIGAGSEIPGVGTEPVNGTVPGSGAGPNTGGGTRNTGGGSAPIPKTGNSTGVSATEIKIGIHAPVTGAAPFPAASFDKGKDLFWSWKGAPKVAGRTVKITFEDDTYNPTTAVDRCRKMAEQEKVFLLVGGGGTDQIQACARYANQRKIPYLSAGVTEIGLRGLDTYFAASMSYPQQAPLLWQMIKKRPEMGAPESVAMIYTNSPNFQDARDAFVEAMKKDQKTLILERKMSKNPSSSEYQQTAAALQASGASIVFILVAPVHYIQLTARTGAYKPWWVGVGVTKGINKVLNTGCNTSGNSIEKSRFFSPFPGVDKIDELDADYNKAYQEKHGTTGDDLGIALWGLNKGLFQMFSKLGNNITRESFIATVGQSAFKTNVFPEVAYTPSNHFGAKGMHLLKGNCATKRYTTEALFATSF